MSSPNNNVKSVKSLSCVIDVTLHLFNVLAAYVTLETGQISQNFLSIKCVDPLFRTPLLKLECYFIVKMLGLTVGLPLRRGVIQSFIAMIFNGIVDAVLVTNIDTKFNFCIILSVLWSLCCLLFVVLKTSRLGNQILRLRNQIPISITGVEDPQNIKNEENEWIHKLDCVPKPAQPDPFSKN
jgi:hypothetical protein